MFRPRLSVALAAPCLAVAAFALAIPSRPVGENRVPVTAFAGADVQTNACYPVAVCGGLAQLDLPQSTGEYVLIVSSLGDALQSYAVHLTAHRVEQAELVPTRPLEPLSLTPGPTRPTRQGSLPNGPAARECSSAAARREFHLHVTEGDLGDPQQYAKVRADLIAEGQHVRVYLDSQIAPEQLHTALVDEITHSFDEVVLPTSRRLLGDYRDVDGDGKFAILISPWLDRLQGGRTSLGGMARGSDFRPDLRPPLSNRSDVLYLNANLRPNSHLRSLLAHEFAHVLCFSRRIADGVGLPSEEDWLTEAIAHLSEDIHGFGWSNLDHRVARFLDEPQSAPLVVADYYRSGLWRDAGCRGATYLFLRWCVDQFGEEVLGRLAAAPARGTANLEIVTGVPFAELYRRWTAALLLSGEEEETSGSRGFDGYRTLDLRGRLGTWQLAGPRLRVWPRAEEPCDLRVRGTSSAFVVLPTADGRSQRISVEADPGARLQISLVRRERTTPGLQIAGNVATAGRH